MRPSRSQRAVTWLALVALIAQLILAFAHHHDHREHAGRAVADGTRPAQTIGSLDDEGPSQVPDDHDCLICWTAAIAGTLIVPLIAFLAIGLISRALHWICHAAPIVQAKGAAQFRARAPPLAVLC